MTGYGRSTFSLGGKNIVLEMKTLNSKSFDLNLRIAPLFKEYEIEIRNILNKSIMRGKTDCTIGYEMSDDKGGEAGIRFGGEKYMCTGRDGNRINLSKKENLKKYLKYQV